MKNIFQTDSNNKLIMPTFVLCHAYQDPIDTLNYVEDFNFNFVENGVDEISFSLARIHDGKPYEMFDVLKDFQVIYIPEWEKHYQIQVGYKDTAEETVKTITGKFLCKAELSQLILNNIEINTEADIVRDAYAVTTIYDEEYPNMSLLNRILKDKAPHYSIKYVSPSLCGLVRSFSIDGQSIDDFLTTTLAEEINCVVEYDSMDKSISLYDVLKVCSDCGHRGDYLEDVCPECGSKNVSTEYGQDTGIIISTKNIAEEITVETDMDSVKTCFNITGGDDMMNAALRAINPNGTSYIYGFSNDIMSDMPETLRERIKSYNSLYASLQPGYKEIMKQIFDLYDEISYYEYEMTGIPEVNTTAQDELNKLKGSTLGNIGIAYLSNTTGKSVVDNAVLGIARLHLSNGYSVKIDSSTFTYSSSGSTWSGKFTVYHYSDEEDTATSPSDITLTVTNDYETYVQQKLDKALANKDAFDIDTDWSKYSLEHLKNYESAYNSCLEALIQSGMLGMARLDVNADALVATEIQSVKSYIGNSERICHVWDIRDLDWSSVDLKYYTTINELPNRIIEACKYLIVLTDDNNKNIMRYLFSPSPFEIYVHGSNNRYCSLYVYWGYQAIVTVDTSYDIPKVTNMYGRYENGNPGHSYVGYQHHYYKPASSIGFNCVGSTYDFLENDTKTPGDVKQYATRNNLEYPKKVSESEYTITSENNKFCTELYAQYYSELKEIQSEITSRETTIATLNSNLSNLEKQQYDIIKQLDFQSYLGEELYNIFCCYRRDENYNNPNYVSDGLNNADLLRKAEELLEAASIQLYKASQTKYTISGTIANFLLMKEFEEFKDECKLGNWIYVQTENDDVYKLRLNGLSGSYDSLEKLQPTFSNAYKSSEPIDMLKDTILKANGMASSFKYVSHQASSGNIASQTLADMMKNGLNAAHYRIMNADNQDIVIDEHGILCRELDELTGAYGLEQSKFINNLLCYTDDGWETVKQAIGKITYVDPELKNTVNKYGVIADTIIAAEIYGSKFVGGYIYSENYWDTGSKGSYINLNNGTFSLGGGAILFDGTSLNVKMDNLASEINLVADQIVLTGKTTFESGESVQDVINNIQISTDDVGAALQEYKDACKNGTTTINGGCIETGTLDADCVSADFFTTASQGSGWTICKHPTSNEASYIYGNNGIDNNVVLKTGGNVAFACGFTGDYDIGENTTEAGARVQIYHDGQVRCNKIKPIKSGDDLDISATSLTIGSKQGGTENSYVFGGCLEGLDDNGFGESLENILPNVHHVTQKDNNYFLNTSSEYPMHVVPNRYCYTTDGHYYPSLKYEVDWGEFEQYKEHVLNDFKYFLCLTNPTGDVSDDRRGYIWIFNNTPEIVWKSNSGLHIDQLLYMHGYWDGDVYKISFYEEKNKNNGVYRNDGTLIPIGSNYDYRNSTSLNFPHSNMVLPINDIVVETKINLMANYDYIIETSEQKIDAVTISSGKKYIAKKDELLGSISTSYLKSESVNGDMVNYVQMLPDINNIQWNAIELPTVSKNESTVYKETVILMKSYGNDKGAKFILDKDKLSLYNNGSLVLESSSIGNKFYGKANSIYIDSTAPTDTELLWVDSVNKIIKAYIDGAWTNVS